MLGQNKPDQKLNQLMLHSKKKEKKKAYYCKGELNQRILPSQVLFRAN
jgi:hypothetical protein